MQVIETDDPCVFVIIFDNREEYQEIRRLTLEHTGKKRISNKQISDFINHVIRLAIGEEKNGQV